MKHLNPKPAGSRGETVLAVGLRAWRGLLVLTCWTLFLVALVAGGLAEMAGRSAARIRVR
jgi:hypothetical protein